MSLAGDLAFGLLNGVTWGLSIALIALGLSLILGLLEIVNLAHGSLYMLGGVSTWFVLDATDSFLLAVIAAPIRARITTGRNSFARPIPQAPSAAISPSA
jgi:branched-subunit amino acid ABC-type transport system permease component